MVRVLGKPGAALNQDIASSLDFERSIGGRQVRGAEVHRAASSHPQHQVRHPTVGACHRLESPGHLDVQVLLPQVWQIEKKLTNLRGSVS